VTLRPGLRESGERVFTNPEPERPMTSTASTESPRRPKDGRLFLKIKIKNLADEARLIRRETAKARDPQTKNQLWLHRTTVVRQAARNTQIAYAFIRGRPYRSVEPKATRPPNLTEVRRMVKQYGVDAWGPEKAAEAERLEKWLTAIAAV
jgi:hypothetical protein